MAAVAAAFGGDDVVDPSEGWDEPQALSEASRAVNRSLRGLMVLVLSHQAAGCPEAWFLESRLAA